MRLLFVCYANVCRSPTAEGVMRRLCEEAGRNDIEIDSAGLHAYLGDPPATEAVRCAAKHGVNLSGLRSRPIKMDDFKDFDLILTMSNGDCEFLELRRPLEDERYQLANIQNFANYADVAEIPNPYGTDSFDKVYDLIETACRRLLNCILTDK